MYVCNVNYAGLFWTEKAGAGLKEAGGVGGRKKLRHSNNCIC